MYVYYIYVSKHVHIPTLDCIMYMRMRVCAHVRISNLLMVLIFHSGFRNSRGKEKYS